MKNNSVQRVSRLPEAVLDQLCRKRSLKFKSPRNFSIDELPQRSFRQVVTPAVLKYDYSACNSILNKIQHEKNVMQETARLKSQMYLTRKSKRNLDRRSDYPLDCVQTTTREKTSRKSARDSLRTYSEMRGLLHSDHSEAVQFAFPNSKLQHTKSTFVNTAHSRFYIDTNPFESPKVLPITNT